jgi:hypothetical protein
VKKITEALLEASKAIYFSLNTELTDWDQNTVCLQFMFCCRYILYDVNPPEGFNLRRDVYMRMAIFVRKMEKLGDWHLVR